MRVRVLGVFLLVAAFVLSAAGALRAGEPAVIKSHALAEFGEPKYGPDFQHWDYANPEAPKGGSITISAVGSFENLNPLPRAGELARSVGLVFDSLMTGSQDELGVLYGLLAESVEYPEDASWIIFNLRPEARFHDGHPVTAEDVVWSFEKLREVGNPFLKTFYEPVQSAEALGPHRVKFTFETRNTRKPLTRVAGLTVYPKHWWEAEGRDIGKGTVQPPLGSGPYRIASVDPGRSIAYERVEDWWGKDLPVNRGLYNVDRIRYDYYKDNQVEFEAFKSGASDFRSEFSSLFWATGYDIAPVRDGRLIKREFETESPRGHQGFFMNTRRPPFDDRRVREALVQLFDFEWTNANLFYGLYKRMDTFFLAENYRQSGLPEGLEREILEEFRGRIPDEIFTKPFELPVTKGDGNIRAPMRKAIELLREAGWELRNGVMTHAETGKPFEFELLLRDSNMERIALPYLKNLDRIGIKGRARVVDSAQFQRRYQDYDYDMISFAYTFFPPPGSELMGYFGSASADVPASGNVMGVRDPVVDALIDRIVQSTDLDTKQAATRALDRVLLWGHYSVPHYHKDVAWTAYWDRFGMPENQPRYDFGFPNTIAFQPSWWIDPAKDARLARRR